MSQDNRERYINFYTGFTRLFEQAEIAKFTKKELQQYEESLKAYRDWYSVTKTAYDKGREEGRAEGIAEGEAKKTKELIQNLLKSGLDVKTIANALDLSPDDINKIHSSL